MDGWREGGGRDGTAYTSFSPSLPLKHARSHIRCGTITAAVVSSLNRRAPPQSPSSPRNAECEMGRRRAEDRAEQRREEGRGQGNNTCMNDYCGRQRRSLEIGRNETPLSLSFSLFLSLTLSLSLSLSVSLPPLSLSLSL